jgi:selenocysteine-specific elongation factor
MEETNLIVGTSGHIDHGKTALIRSLTGVELDSLPEERERGITISLGFCSLDLPDGRQVSFVDVPGHERLVRTMVAGAVGIDGVLLCVSAVEGVMPQTREHLEILGLLGVQSGAVVLTKVDLVDEELLEFAREDVLDLLAGGPLEGASIIPYSSVTGQGKEELLAAMMGFKKLRRHAEGPFRLPVDRVFTRDGFGTIVTGTVCSGSVTRGEEIRILPDGRTSRLRGLELHGQEVAKVVAGSRAALNLSGVERQELQRGLVISQGRVPCSSMVDVSLRTLSDAPELKDGARIRVLLGTTERIAKVYIARDEDVLGPNEELYAQLRLDAPLPCMPGDKFIVRRVSPLETIGGGEVVDPWAGRMRRKVRAAYGEQLARLHGGDYSVWLERAGESGLPAEEWLERTGNSEIAVLLGDRFFGRGVLARLEGILLEGLASYHAEQPLSLGPHRRELRRGRLGHLSDKVFDALVDRLARIEAVSIQGPLVCVRGHSVELTAAQASLRAQIVKSIMEAKWEGLSVESLHKRYPQPEVVALMRLIDAESQATHVSGVGWVARENTVELKSILRTWFELNDQISPGEFKAITSLTRKRAIPFLEWCDDQRWTRRRGNLRMRGDKLTSS